MLEEEERIQKSRGIAPPLAALASTVHRPRAKPFASRSCNRRGRRRGDGRRQLRTRPQLTCRARQPPSTCRSLLQPTAPYGAADACFAAEPCRPRHLAHLAETGMFVPGIVCRTLPPSAPSHTRANPAPFGRSCICVMHPKNWARLRVGNKTLFFSQELVA